MCDTFIVCFSSDDCVSRWCKSFVLKICSPSLFSSSSISPPAPQLTLSSLARTPPASAGQNLSTPTARWELLAKTAQFELVRGMHGFGILVLVWGMHSYRNELLITGVHTMSVYDIHSEMTIIVLLLLGLSHGSDCGCIAVNIKFGRLLNPPNSACDQPQLHAPIREELSCNDERGNPTDTYTVQVVVLVGERHGHHCMCTEKIKSQHTFS